MTRVNAKGYFDAEDSSDLRYEKRKALNEQRVRTTEMEPMLLGAAW